MPYKRNTFRLKKINENVKLKAEYVWKSIDDSMD